MQRGEKNVQKQKERIIRNYYYYNCTNFNSYIGYNKEKKVGVVVLSNISAKNDVNMTFIGNKILHEMLDK